jgi:hypothetical protein
MLKIRSLGLAMTIVLVGALAAPSPAREHEPAQDEDLAYAIKVQTYIAYIQLMDL